MKNKNLIPTRCSVQMCYVIHQGTHSMYHLRELHIQLSTKAITLILPKIYHTKLLDVSEPLELRSVNDVHKKWMELNVPVNGIIDYEQLCEHASTKHIWVTSTIFWLSQLHACCVCDTLQTSREATNLILNQSVVEKLLPLLN